MRNYWLVAKHEYRRMVFRRSFIVITLAIPLGMIALIALVIFIETSGESKLPLGYVDQTGILDESLLPALADSEDRITLQSFPNDDAAMAALDREEIQAFFVFPPEYPNPVRTELYYLQDPPSNDAWRDLDDFVRLNLLAVYPDQVGERLFAGPEITVFDTSSGREFSEASIINVVLPFVATFFFFIATMSASGYMLQVVADEKENRTMEIMLTSVTPNQLIIGKAFGLLAAALTQLAIYVVAVVIGLRVAAPYVVELQQVPVPWTYLGLMALFFFPSYALISAIMVGIGGAVSELQQGQQVAGMLNLLFMMPLFLLILIFENPGGPFVVFMSLFPTSAFMTISLRWGLGTVPVWQLGASWVILVGTTAFAMWVAARVFRMGMLRYGQPLNLRGALAAIRKQ
jgi:ABC-2 type transport system permease protein